MAGKKPTGMKVSQPKEGGTVKVSMKIDNSGGAIHSVEVPINKAWTPTQKRDEIMKWINDYSDHGNKPFKATASGTDGITVTDSAGNQLAELRIDDKTGQTAIETTYGLLGNVDSGKGHIKGKPTGLNFDGNPASATAGIVGVFIATTPTQGFPSACGVMDELRSLLVPNGIPAEIDAEGNLTLPLDLPNATAFRFGTDDVGCEYSMWLAPDEQ